MSEQAIRVTVWNEFRHDKNNPAVKSVYPDGMHGAIAARLQQEPGITARTATLAEPEHGLTKEVLADTDVLTWWGHMAHEAVSDEIVDRVQQRILEGLGRIFYFSPGHELYPIYHNPTIQKVIVNAVRWATFQGCSSVKPFYAANTPPLEKVPPRSFNAEPIPCPTEAQ